MRRVEFDTSNLCKNFNINGSAEIIEIFFEGKSSHEGELNPFYGKKHTKETKEKLKKIILKLYEDENFRMTRFNPKEKNGMYGSSRTGKLNPMWGKNHSEETKRKQSEKRKEWFRNNESPHKGKPCLESTKKKLSEKNSKEYQLVSPYGETIKVKNLTKFAKDNDLSIGCLQQVVSGRNKSHRGWKNAS
jgi:hypothetical protein